VLLEARAARAGDRVTLRVRVDVPADTVTQSPSPDASLAYDAEGATYASVVTAPRGVAHRFDDLPRAWRLALDFGAVTDADAPWPVRVGLASTESARVWNGADVYLPAEPGTRWIAVTVRPPVAARVARLALLRDGAATGVASIELP
jgi:hypothetical protein